jgi:hypothetical protein
MLHFAPRYFVRKNCRVHCATTLLSWRFFEMKLAALLLFVTFAAAAQTPQTATVAVQTPHAATAAAQTPQAATPVTDADKIADALRAGPTFITKDATILDWPATKGGEYRVLRKGTSEWSCLPAFPGYAHDEPGCFDAAFMDWVKQSLAGEEPHIDRVGIAYMYGGAWVPNKSADAHTAKGEDFHVGPHIMIVSPHENQKELQSFSPDGSNGMPYVAHLPGGTDLYLVMPIRQVGEK